MQDDKTVVLGVDAVSPLVCAAGGEGERRALEPGSTVGDRYRVDSLLGQGGMGRI
jgi:eukaryotic-like serine/threonine-protein kinase